jgi:phospholipase/lecithinase/hemolysin
MKLLAAAFAFFCSSLAFSASVNQIVVFGDSLSDNGNLYEYMKHQLPVSPPYYKGRFTNGPVWIEILTSHFYPGSESRHLLDYAFGGAGILKDEEEDDTLFTLKKEIDTFLLSHDGKADENSLYVVWIGANNYLGMPDEVQETVDVVLGGIEKGVKRLVNAGAKHILLVNLPDLGRTPAARDFDAIPLLTRFSKLHNDTLYTNFLQYKVDYPEVDWIFLSVHDMLNEVFDDPESLGFSNVKDTCYEAMWNGDEISVLKMVASVKPKARKDACTGFLFFDPVHPAALAHEILSERARLALEAAGIEFQQ